MSELILFVVWVYIGAAMFAIVVTLAGVTAIFIKAAICAIFNTLMGWSASL